MTDINEISLSEEEIDEAIELLFFAYRDFISDPDKVLADYKIGDSTLGRAHHRVIHFVGRNPGMTVAELLEILQITKQSLSRVLRQLLDEGFVRQERGREDARQRLLYLTEKGESFEARLAAPQKDRFRAALKAAGPEGHRAFVLVMEQLIDASAREQVLALIRKDRG
ncbi:MAG: MarR family transcriptional regulator [Alphaproteobacteria bacterium]|nr:MarR family transcriptional regulator [Alphaproteobacteria bacterium]